jgi:N-succinyldiaminopimelate aminotransferase
LSTDHARAGIAALVRSPFERLRDLLGHETAGQPAIDMSIGEPRHPEPPMLADILGANLGAYAKYPPIRGTDELRGAIADWVGRRYPPLAGALDPGRHVLPLVGSREGLFSAIFPAMARKPLAGLTPAVLIPNPFYQAYAAGAIAAGAEPVLLPAGPEHGFLPALDLIPQDVLRRAVAFYLASPANPQGAIADPNYLRAAIALARTHDFMLFVDECYSEIYTAAPPPGGLEAAMSLGKPGSLSTLGCLGETGTTSHFDHIAVFNSLSKRSNVPGLRSGFIAGDPDFLACFAAFRNVACTQMPLPHQCASAALWSDESHVERNRDLYRAKFALADQILAPLFGRVSPAGGFFLWLDVARWGGGEAVASRLWSTAGLRVLPGSFLAFADGAGVNPGADYIRLALVDDSDTTRTGLSRIAGCLAG